MKYYPFLLGQMLPEWREAYLDYLNLRKILLPLKKHLQSFKEFTHSDDFFIDLIPSERYLFRKISDAFIDFLIIELRKVAKFAEFQIFQTTQQWKNLLQNAIIHVKAKDLEQSNEKEKILMDIFHQFYTKLHYLQKFLDLNSQILSRILKKYHKYTEVYDNQINFKKLNSEYLLKLIKFDEIGHKFWSIRNHFSKKYKSTFYAEQTNIRAIEALQRFTQEKQLSHKEAYFFFFLAGFSFVLCIFVLFLALDGQFEDQTNFFKNIFPIFRGASFIVLYIFLLAWNVYGWKKFNINYRKIFKFNHHYSTLGQILKRAMFFWAILLITFLWFVLINNKLGSFSDYLNFMPKKLICLIIWIVLFGYMFFPSKKYCNGQGRLYVFRLLWKIICLSFFQVDFVVNWATDQLVSFVTPLKDLEYTFCHFIQYGIKGNNHLANGEICSEKTIYIGFVASALPLFFRMIQCMRLTRQNWHKKDYYFDILNFFKYFSSLLVAIFSFGAAASDTHRELFFNGWMAFAVISTLYSYSWDIKMDWGLLKAKNLLREKILYHTKYYYLAICINFLFRCCWVMTISNGVNPLLIMKVPKEVSDFVFGFIEMFRRAIWNFLRVEKEYIFNTDLYKLYEDMRLPYPLDATNSKYEKATGLLQISKEEEKD